MSIVMSIMYLARFTRADLIFTVGMLSTHCSNPTYSHFKQACKLLHYIATNDDIVIVFKSGAIVPIIYADASHAIHNDGKGHGCVLMKIGSGLVYSRSFKLKLITLSSTESEWVVLCEATVLAEWIKSMLLTFNVELRPINVRQDNTSAIWLAEHGASFARTKHLLVKKNKAKEGILNGIITISYTPTECMIADMGTKPLSHRILKLHMKNSGYMVPIVENGRLIRILQIEVPASRKIRKNIVALPVPIPIVKNTTSINTALSSSNSNKIGKVILAPNVVKAINYKSKK